jgi:predicted XRE-type DNA-binding protein
MSNTRHAASVSQEPWLNDFIERRGPEFRAAVEAELSELRLEQQLVRLRERAGLTQAEVARRLGVTQPVVARFEAGRAQRVEVRTVARHAAALGYRMHVTFVRSQGPRTSRGRSSASPGASTPRARKRA